MLKPKTKRDIDHQPIKIRVERKNCNGARNVFWVEKYYLGTPLNAS